MSPVVVQLGRRRMLGGMGAAGALLALGPPAFANAARAAVPITRGEREARIERARSLMRSGGIDALLVEPSASLVYFTGVSWSRSERLTAAIIPVRGEIFFVTPAFEEPRLRERLKVPAEVRTWQEHEDPFAQVAALLRDRRATGTIGIEESVRHFVSDGLARALPNAKLLSGAGVVRGCRMIKSPAEIALMRAATEVTLASIDHAAQRVTPGITSAEIAALIADETSRRGARHEFALVLVGEASAYPHGAAQEQRVGDGSIILMDCGCAVEGYQSDVTRSFAYGSASDLQRRVYGHVREGQRAALAAARIGVPAGEVDDAVRRHYQRLGYGIDYQLPGLSHRTGHGIGLEGHEPVHLVTGERTRLRPGMCFSNEPGIYLPGRFGIRIEDCFTVTEEGPLSFSRPPDDVPILGR